MSLKLEKLKGFQGRKGPLVLLILDGIGLAPDGPANAVSLAKTPCLDDLFANCPLQTQLKAHGPAVGLPAWSDIGNSEVGHNALGAGRVFAQGAKLVNGAIETGSLFATPLWQKFMQVGERDSTLHFIGLLSDGNVHSHIDHLFALMQRAAESGCKKLAIHALLDGRDVAPKSALGYIEQTEKFCADLKQKGCDAAIASGGGRMHVTMDRYNADWSIVERGFRAHVKGDARKFASAQQAVETLYEEGNHDTDQYLEAFVVTDANGSPLAPIEDGDGVIFFNFRGDRSIEISRAFTEESFHEFNRGPRPDVLFAGMMQYDGDLKVPKDFLVEPPSIDRSISHYLADSGVTSFAISETQKYGHVTYFWNGNCSGYINEALEDFFEIPSDKLPFDRAPKMKAAEIATKSIELLESKKYRFGRVNFPNGDMVGHTGVLPAAVTAVEEVDRCTAMVIESVRKLQGITVVLADHGNCEEMFVEKNGERTVKTSHTTNLVPFFICDAEFQGEYKMRAVENAGLTHVASTLLNLMGFVAPEDYDPSLIELR